MSAQPPRPCAFCPELEENEEIGKLLVSPDGAIVAHSNCMLFSPQVVSKDTYSQDFFGELNVKSVETEIERARKLRCFYCKAKGASVGCNNETCRRTYHYLCVKKANGKYVCDPEKEIYIAFCSEHKDTEENTTNISSHLPRSPPESPTPENPTSQSPTPESPKLQHELVREMRADRGAALEAYEQLMAIQDRQAKAMEDLGATMASGQERVAAGMEKMASGQERMAVALEKMTDAQERHNQFFDSMLQRVTAQLNQSQRDLVPSSTDGHSPLGRRKQIKRRRLEMTSSVRKKRKIEKPDGTAVSGRCPPESQSLNQEEPKTGTSGTQRLQPALRQQSTTTHQPTQRQAPYITLAAASVGSDGEMQFETDVESTLVEASEESPEQLKDGETVAEDITAENTVVTDEAPSFYNPVLEMDSEKQPATNVPVYPIISSPSKTSPVIKQCTKEQPVGSSTNETNSAPSIKGKTEEKKIVLHLRRLIPWLPNTTHTNGRSHMRSLDGSIITEHCIDEPAVENVMLTAQAIGCKVRLATQLIDSTYDEEDMCVAQPVGSCIAEIIPVAMPNDLLNKSSHADSMGYIKLNRPVNEKSVVCPNVKMPFAVQLKREIKLLYKQSTKVPNSLGTIPSLSPLSQDVYDSTSVTCPSVSPLAQHVYGGTSETCPSVSPLAQDVYDGTSGTCPSVSPLAQDVYSGTSETCPSVSPLAQDVYDGTSGTCPSVSPLAQDVYGGISGTCPSISPHAQYEFDGTSVKCPSVSSPAQDVDGGTSGFCPLVSLAQDVHVGTSGTCPLVSPFAQDVYDGTSGTCPSISFAQDVHVDISGTCPSVSSLTHDVYVSTLVSPLAQDVHVEQPTTSLIGIDDASLEDLPQAFTCPDVRAPETDREARLSHFPSPAKISEMSAKLVTGALSKQFNFSNIAMQIKSPIRSAKPSLSHSSNGKGV
ncbi:uncharacterized protein LOC135005972 [Pseudophryne corroboree]|uniref:uncharacterized protein LOC135005972 n=1 Tax=Pseudophryne corroboree TaxID=495146 RepID=UPI00308205F5